VKNIIPTGAKCGCPCGSGIASATATDLLVVAAVSNWGCTGIEACLASYLDFPEVLHDGDTELEAIKISSMAGGNHALSGMSEVWVDGIPGRLHAYLVEIVRYILSVRQKDFWGLKEFKMWAQPDKRPIMHQKILKWAGYYKKVYG
jgi:hypothetical protein